MKVGGGAAVTSHWPQFHTCEMGEVVLHLLGMALGKAHWWLWDTLTLQALISGGKLVVSQH